MTLPANIRVNASAPFPAIVKGQGVIVVNKSNGIWTISLNFGGLVQQSPVADPTNTLVLIWNKLTGVFNTTTLNQLSGSKVIRKVGGGGQPTSPYAAQVSDDVILVYAVPFTITVDWSTRTSPLRIVDQSGAALPANPITITPAAGQTQLASVNYSYLIDGSGGSITLTPLPDGTGAY